MREQAISAYDKEGYSTPAEEGAEYLCYRMVDKNTKEKICILGSWFQKDAYKPALERLSFRSITMAYTPLDQFTLKVEDNED